MLGTINPYWQNVVDGFYFGNYPDTKYKITEKLAIVDSGWTVLSAPKTEMEFIIKNILKGVTYTKDASGRYFMSCET